MARRTKEEAAIPRQQLLAAAEEVFREHGSRPDVAGGSRDGGRCDPRCGLLAFQGQGAALFAAICERATLPLDAMLAAASGETTADPLGALRDLMVGALRHLATDRRAKAVFEIIFLKTEMCGELGEVVGRRDRERCDCLLQVEKLVRRAMDLGRLPANTDAALTTQLLQACMGGLMREWVFDPTVYDLAKDAPRLVEGASSRASSCIRRDVPSACARTSDRGQRHTCNRVGARRARRCDLIASWPAPARRRRRIFRRR
jgi:TetR/AcrR family acrAB operon transcriptional repressor